MKKNGPPKSSPPGPLFSVARSLLLPLNGARAKARARAMARAMARARARVMDRAMARVRAIVDTRP